MLTHGQIWSALDRLAEQHGMSISALAKRAGLDATTFNRSKRVTADGRPRWPSTESVAKVLAATGASVEDFFCLLGPALGPPDGAYHPPGFAEEAPAPLRFGRAIPHAAMALAAGADLFDTDGRPTGGGWDEILFPDMADGQLYALEIAGDAMAPAYRDGDVVVVSPTASVRRGDRVIVRTQAGEMLARELVRRTARMVELRALNPVAEVRRLAVGELQWMARIVWVSQ